ncbi:TonB-dependent receptor [Sphingomonas profundi]|uniref:TonB-dependent receptor n=1 Tax=Alterirhizorhabdus profundi TaxID=2681549 RepID=UPI0012E8BD1C|nr:TonB-dependent receptor [Sphingomonas profundi]
MKNSTKVWSARLFAAGVSLASMTTAAMAQTTPAPETPTPPVTSGAENEENGEILVTARRRDETSIAVPVSLTAVGAAELQRRAINTIDGLARAVPSLIVGEGGGTVQGGIIAIRGIAGSDSNPFGDQAVSFNIDGVQVARATVRRLSEMDISQVEVLKGPQALFFGKNSPAGIISVRTADPTSTLQAKLSTGYEFKGDEVRSEGYISGPLTDTLGFRIAGYFSDIKGYLKNVAPDSGVGIFGDPDSRTPNATEYAVRGTLKWAPNDQFDARLKLTYNHIKGTASTAQNEIVNCPLGVSQGNGPLEDCKANGTVALGQLGPNFGTVDARFGDGQTFLRQHQVLGGLELNYHLNDSLTLSSVTGYYDVTLRNRGNFTSNYLDTGVLPRQILASFNFLDIREITEELRLASNFDGPVNFLAGGLIQDSHAVNGSVTFRNANNPGQRNPTTGGFVNYINNYRLVQNGLAYSVFGQMQVTFLEHFELSVGGRYSYERKKLPVFTTAGNGGVTQTPGRLVEIDGIDRSISFNNLSPEATLTYRPTQNLTVYGAYKEGFLSGGYNSVAPAVTTAAPLATGRFATLQNPIYNQQLIKGYEGGIKASLLDGALRTNLSAYNYKTTGLQVSVTIQGTQQELRNAGSVRTKGVEFDFTYRTPLEGLTLNGAVNYNKGEYLDYQASCYRGESSSRCFTQLNRVTGQNALLQDLSGTQLVRAPEWTGNLGFNYEMPIGALKLGLSGNASHSDGYFSDTVSAPGGFQKGYELYDASIRLSTEDDKWELALIGRNLGNTYYFVRSTDVPFTGSAPGAAAVGTLGDTAAPVSRGRETMLRLSYRFGG